MRNSFNLVFIVLILQSFFTTLELKGQVSGETNRVDVLEKQVSSLQRELAEIKALLKSLTTDNGIASGEKIPVAAEVEQTLSNVLDDVDYLKAMMDLDEELVDSFADNPLFQMRGFAHVSFSIDDIDNKTAKDDKTDDFALGGLDLFINSKLSDRISFLNETVFEPTDDGEYVLDVERVIIKYRFSDSLNLQTGRFHTTLGYWNEAFHHGEWLQTSIGRPDILAFEDDGGLLPVHLVGLVAKGKVGNDSVALDYTLEVGNGRGALPDPPQITIDANDSKAINFALALRPFAIEGLRLGGNIYFDKIPENLDAGTATDPLPLHNRMDERIIGANIVYTRNPWDLIAEYFSVDHDVKSGNATAKPASTTSRSAGYYIQLGYNIDEWTPYVRYDAVDIDNDDIFFLDTTDRKTYSIGIRWDASSWNALKLQLSHSETSVQKINKIELQSSFAF